MEKRGAKANSGMSNFFLPTLSISLPAGMARSMLTPPVALRLTPRK